jgi:3-deoxy-D-arabino-heptulosonate 7-phosphate (DAHP) synthase
MPRHERHHQWLMAADMLARHLTSWCERGIRTFEKATRDLWTSAGAIAQRLSHLPVT